MEIIDILTSEAALWHEGVIAGSFFGAIAWYKKTLGRDVSKVEDRMNQEIDRINGRLIACEEARDSLLAKLADKLL